MTRSREAARFYWSLGFKWHPKVQRASLRSSTGGVAASCDTALLARDQTRAASAPERREDSEGVREAHDGLTAKCGAQRETPNAGKA